MVKKNLLVSFSGGETSAFMAQWLWRKKQDEYNMVFVFANTGLENEETLDFVQKCSEAFGFKVHWVEAVVHHGIRKGTTHKEVTYETASRDGDPFEEHIKKYGIPNMAFPHCTRETKLNPIKSFAKQYFEGEHYHTAIGIRIDEIDRMNAKREEFRLIYPLIHSDMIPRTKKQVNAFWKLMPFRLNLKGYQGNCKTCWKKSDKKLFTIAQETPEYFDFFQKMEENYSRVGAEIRKDPTAPDRTFFRGNRPTKIFLEQAQDFEGVVLDDSDSYDYDLVGGDSCEVFSECNIEENET